MGAKQELEEVTEVAVERELTCWSSKGSCLSAVLPEISCISHFQNDGT